jgi:hypothetical protein
LEGNVVTRQLLRCRRVGAFVLVGLASSALAGCEAPESSVEASAPVTEVPAVAQAPKPPIERAVALTREQRVEALKRVIEPRLDRSREGLEERTLANGKKGVHLHGRFGHATVLRVNPDGSRERGCFDETQAAVDFATGEQTP